MLSNPLGILGVLAVLPAMAQTTGGAIASPAAKQKSSRQHAPMRFHDGTANSENWSGYAVTGSSFTNATASWFVPTVNCSKTPNTYAAFWVGIDGYSSNTVEQTGTDSDCDGASPSYYAWYEF